MISLIRDLFPVLRDFGLRRLGVVFALTLLQALMQTIAVFSLIPLLSAAADMARFRATRGGEAFVALVGDGSDRHVLLWAGGLSLGVLIAGNLVTLTAEYARARYAQGLAHRLRDRMVRELLERRFEYFAGVQSAVMLKRLIDDTAHLASDLVGPLLDSIARILLIVLLVALVLAIEPLVVLGGAVVMTAYYFAVMRPIRRRARRASDTIKREMRALYFEIGQILSGIRPIMATGRKDYFAARSERVSRQVSRELPLYPMFAAIPRSGLEIVVFGGMIAWLLIVLATGGDLIALLPRLGLVAVVAYRLMPSLQALLAQLAAMTAARSALEEVTGLLREHEPRDAPAAASPAVEPLEWHDEIRFENVTFTYAGAAEPAIAGVSFAIAKGAHVAFVGPTGSGKSTLIDLMLGLLEPTSGTILVDGSPLTAERMPEWRRAIGYVPQDVFLLDGTIAENIAFGWSEEELDHQRVAEVARLAQAEEFIGDGRAGGFAARVGERGARLSGGQRQRLALARALYSRPNLLVLDEATSALDAETERRVVAALADSHERLTVVTVTHRLATVRDCDCIHYVEDGRIVASGDFASLQARHAGFGRQAS